MPKAIYTAQVHVVGGRGDGRGTSSDGALDVNLRRPGETDGDSEPGTNPEQLFAVGYSACFSGALGAAARRERVEIGQTTIDASVSLYAVEGGAFKLGVALDVTLPEISDAEQAKRLVAAAHEVCPYSNATRGNIDVTLTANGQPVA